MEAAIVGGDRQQGLRDGALEMAVRALDGAVLVRHAAVVAAWRHPVVRAQRLLAPGLVFTGLTVEVAEGG